MHIETAAWTREVLASVDLPAGGSVLDIGSSTLHFRTVEQPHIEREVLAPLRARGMTIVHLDAKDAEGVDIVCDLDRANGALADRLGEYALVLLTSVLHSLREPGRTLDLAARTLAPGGYLVVHHPESARRTFDPIDHKLRLTPEQVAAELEGCGLRRVRVDSVRIDDPRYYHGLVSRPSWALVLGSWLPLPGATEQVRRRIPALRWRQSCVLMQRS